MALWTDSVVFKTAHHWNGKNRNRKNLPILQFHFWHLINFYNLQWNNPCQIIIVEVLMNGYMACTIRNPNKKLLCSYLKSRLWSEYICIKKRNKLWNVSFIIDYFNWATLNLYRSSIASCRVHISRKTSNSKRLAEYNINLQIRE